MISRYCRSVTLLLFFHFSMFIALLMKDKGDGMRDEYLVMPSVHGVAEHLLSHEDKSLPLLYVLLAAAKHALGVFLSHAGYRTLYITAGIKCFCCDACSPYLLSLCQEFTVHARASGWTLCSRCSVQLVQSRTKQCPLPIIFAKMLQPPFSLFRG